MQILTKEETRELRLKSGMIMLTNELIENIEKCEVGGAVSVHWDEWTLKTIPSSAYVNRFFISHGSPIRCKMRTTQLGKDYVFFRIK